MPGKRMNTVADIGWIFVVHKGASHDCQPEVTQSAISAYFTTSDLGYTITKAQFITGGRTQKGRGQARDNGRKLIEARQEKGKDRAGGGVARGSERGTRKGIRTGAARD